MPATPSACFPSTAWSCIEAVRDPQHPKYVLAVNRLITTYWRPAFYFLRRKYPTAADPEGLTQQFFLSLVTKGWLARADQTRGRFRDLLQTMLKRFAFDQTVRAPEQAKFEQRFVSIQSLMQDSDRAFEPTGGESPEEAFDKAWQTALLRTVRDNLQAHYAATCDAAEWQRFEIFAALHFAEPSAQQPTQDALARRFGITRDQVPYALEQVRKRWERLLRQEIRDQTGADLDVEAEIRQLLTSRDSCGPWSSVI